MDSNSNPDVTTLPSIAGLVRESAVDATSTLPRSTGDESIPSRTDLLQPTASPSISRRSPRRYLSDWLCGKSNKALREANETLSTELAKLHNSNASLAKELNSLGKTVHRDWSAGYELGPAIMREKIATLTKQMTESLAQERLKSLSKHMSDIAIRINENYSLQEQFMTDVVSNAETSEIHYTAHNLVCRRYIKWQNARQEYLDNNDDGPDLLSSSCTSRLVQDLSKIKPHLSKAEEGFHIGYTISGNAEDKDGDASYCDIPDRAFVLDKATRWCLLERNPKNRSKASG
ncbi:uncharacterized protein IL334_006466 [Kwoniella shivajii]|uniref:Uncharacterized protein n=1 Tax=Kwoniella shivajii TaxID=564305 RepID=A0ABZ1D6D4_9TREE|nr:hypothetical protein IL334_006466 [Kwoniella shivajii]